MSFFDLLQGFLNFFLDLLSIGKAKLTNTLNIYVKSNTGGTISVDLDPKWDIKNVKEIVAPKLGLQPEEVKIIFAGKELLDSTLVEDCDLGEQSILHAVQIRSRVHRASKPLCETLEELQDDDNVENNANLAPETPATTAEGKHIAHFFVYCSTCKKMEPGKLRVRCSLCKSGAFTVDNDPQRWSHVLEPDQITGTCHDTSCSGGLYAEFFFKCASHVSGGEEDTATPLHLIRNNTHSVPCLACTDVSEVAVVFPCHAGHVTCLECFRNYCTSRLRERQFFSHPTYGYTLSCPAGCQDSFISEVHHFRLLTVDQYNQYQRYAAEEFVLQAGGLLCPQPGCGAGIIPDPDCGNVVCLHGCGFVFCAKCLQGSHLGECVEQDVTPLPTGNCEYAVDPNRAEKSRWDEASRVTIRVSTKPCPKCRTSTERDGGCMHMVCTRANCGYDWCWVCQGPWTRECMGSHWFG